MSSEAPLGCKNMSRSFFCSGKAGCQPSPDCPLPEVEAFFLYTLGLFIGLGALPGCEGNDGALLEGKAEKGSGEA